MTREEAKELFRSDKDAYGKPHHIMKNIDKIYDDFEKVQSLPPAEGDEDILPDYTFDELFPETAQPTAEGADPKKVRWSGYGELGNCFQRQQPTAGGAEEILAKGRILMYGNIIVDPIMLPEGIYATKELRIYLPETTIEHLMEMGKSFRDKTQTQWLPDSYFDNLSKCELIDVDVVRDATLHAQRIAEKMKEANQFILDIAGVLGIETDGVGFDGLTLSIDDFKEAADKMVSDRLRGDDYGRKNYSKK